MCIRDRRPDNPESFRNAVSGMITMRISETPCECLKRMCAVLMREPHFEHHPPSVREAPHKLVRGAKARATF
eukprot:71005-Pyramimonas_sp.AAC.1